MDFSCVEKGFLEELAKIGASTMRVAQSREGRRPMSVGTMLKKEKDGTLFKYDSMVKEAPEDEKKAAIRFEKAAAGMGMPIQAYAAADTDKPEAVAPKKPRRRFEIPSREDVVTRQIDDQRSNMVVIPGSGTQLAEIGATATPGGERTY